jgi:acyl-CoA thioesterase I
MIRFSTLALIAAMLFLAAADAYSASKSCAAPRELIRLQDGLPRTAARLMAHENLTVVAIGSSSTAGYGASSASLSYPSQFAAEFRRRLPDEPIEVLNRGVGGQFTEEMVARFDRDVIAALPDLVIWQVGTNTVLHDHDIESHSEIMRSGLALLRNAGIDVVIMDMQYAPTVLAHPRYSEMERSLFTLAKEQRVAIFHRFALMQSWIESGELDFATMLSPDGLHLNDLTYGCIGRILADAVIDDAASSRVASGK